MSKYKVEQIKNGVTGDKVRRTKVVDESKVSATRAGMRDSMRSRTVESSDRIRVTRA